MAKTAIRVAKASVRKPSLSGSRRGDLKYLRKEVLDFTGLDAAGIRQAIMDTLNHNNYMYTTKEGIEWLDIFAKKTLSPNDFKAYKAAEDWRSSITLCTFAKMVNAGCDIGNKNMEFLKKGLDIITKAGYDKRNKDNKSKPIPKQSKHVSEVMSAIDDALDAWPKPVDMKACIGNNAVSRADIENIKEFYKKEVEFVTEALNDPEMISGYFFLKTKMDRKSYINRLQKIVDDLDDKKPVRVVTTRKPRAKKVKSADSLVKNLRYQTESKEYKIASKNPSTIIGANMALLFNTEKRHLMLLKSKEGFGVTGTTITNIDEATSFKKTLRKPNEVLPVITKATKARVEKAFGEIKTTAQVASGRSNEQTLILKIY